MQRIIIDETYQFVPPVRSRFWPSVFRFLMPGYLRRSHGLESLELLGIDRLRKSIEAGHGILLTPNHCRPCDPMVVALLAQQAGQPVYIMASWHLFKQTAFQSWLLPRIGVFSVYREGMDRESLKFAIQAVANAERPLVLFPEGVITRTNDRLNNFMDGTAFLARHAAKQRAGMNPPGRVVIHPVAIRYFFRGNLDQALAPVLEDIERRLSWRPMTGRSITERLVKIGDALLTLKEIEYLGAPQIRPLDQRLKALIDNILRPLETEWLKGKSEGDVIGRIKAIRTAILPDMVTGDIDEAERTRRWAQLADTYLAQQIHFYPPEYFGPSPSPEQIMETVERFEEDLTDRVRIHRPIHVVAEVGEAIEVNPARERGAETDPLMARLRADLTSMLDRRRSQRPTR